MTEPLIEKHPISTELSNVNREKHKLKSFPLTVYIINNPASSAKALPKYLQQKQCFPPTQSPSERKYASSFN